MEIDATWLGFERVWEAAANIEFRPTARSFLFLRHGETEQNRLGVTQGHWDVPLNHDGRAQAVEAATILHTHPVEAIYSSDLQRAHETARVVSSHIGRPIKLDERLRERCFGVLERGPRRADAWTVDPEGGESVPDFTRRTLAGVADLLTHEGALICAHGGTLRVLAAALEIRMPAEGFHNARPICFERREGIWGFEFAR